jgi:hypothetical protein
MAHFLDRIIKRVRGYISKKNSSDCNDQCPYYKLYRNDYQNYQINRNNCHEDIKISIERLIKENEKYFTYEIERTTFDCITCGSRRTKTMGYSHRVAYEIFERYGIFIYVSDLGAYINSPAYVKYELRKLICIYGIEKVTEEIAIYLKNNYPQRFGISIVCKQ